MWNIFRDICEGVDSLCIARGGCFSGVTDGGCFLRTLDLIENTVGVDGRARRGVELLRMVSE